MKLSTISAVVRLCLLLQCSFAVNEDFIDSMNARCACPGETLIFTCTVVDRGSGGTVWGGSAFNCQGNEITLIHHNFIRGTSAECNDRAIIGKSVGVSDDETCFTSQLNVTVSIGLNDKTVNCSDSGMQHIGSSTIVVAGACSEVQPVVNLTDVRPGQLTFNWSRLDSECSIVQYLITSDCGNCSGSVSDGTSAVCSNLQLSETEGNCTFSVMSRTRGFNGTPSNPVTVTLKVPGPPQVDFIPVYSSSTKTLIRFIARIDQMDSFSIYEGISGSIVNYTFHFLSSANSITKSSASCMDSICEHMILVPTTECQTLGDTSMVSVSASNMLGPGQSSGPFPLECMNVFVMVNKDVEPSTLTCLFLNNQSTSTKVCSVEYGQCNEQTTFRFEENSTLEFPDRVTIQIDLPSGSDCKMYTISASNGTTSIVIVGERPVPTPGGSNLIITVVVPIIAVILVVTVTVAIIIVIVIFNCRKRARGIKWKMHKAKPQNDDSNAIDHSDARTVADRVDEHPSIAQMKNFELGEVDSYRQSTY